MAAPYHSRTDLRIDLSFPVKRWVLDNNLYKLDVVHYAVVEYKLTTANGPGVSRNTRSYCGPGNYLFVPGHAGLLKCVIVRNVV